MNSYKEDEEKNNMRSLFCEIPDVGKDMSERINNLSCIIISSYNDQNSEQLITAIIDLSSSISKKLLKYVDLEKIMGILETCLTDEVPEINQAAGLLFSKLSSYSECDQYMEQPELLEKVFNLFEANMESDGIFVSSLITLGNIIDIKEDCAKIIVDNLDLFSICQSSKGRTQDAIESFSALLLMLTKYLNKAINQDVIFQLLIELKKENYSFLEPKILLILKYIMLRWEGCISIDLFNEYKFGDLINQSLNSDDETLAKNAADCIQYFYRCHDEIYQFDYQRLAQIPQTEGVSDSVVLSVFGAFTKVAQIYGMEKYIPKEFVSYSLAYFVNRAFSLRMEAIRFIILYFQFASFQKIDSFIDSDLIELIFDEVESGENTLNWLRVLHRFFQLFSGAGVVEDFAEMIKQENIDTIEKLLDESDSVRVQQMASVFHSDLVSSGLVFN